MRIAIIKSNYTPYGGGEKYASRLIEAFASRNVSVDVLTSETTEWTGKSPNIRHVRMKRARYNNLARLLSFNASVNSHLKQEHYDCILGMDRSTRQTHLRAGGGCHAAWIERRCRESSFFRCLSFRLNPFHRTMIQLEKTAFLDKELKRIFCNSELVKNDIIQHYPDAIHKLMVIHNGIEWHEFSQPFQEAGSLKKKILKDLCVADNMFYFLFLGSGFDRKGLEKAIYALHRLPSRIHLLVVGKDKNERWYRRLAIRLGILERVHFFGPQENVIPFFQVSDAFILPTIYDPFSNASLEALAMGLYTVTSSSNGCSEVIRKGSGKVIEDLHRHESVSDAMNSALHESLSKHEIRESVKYLDFQNQLNTLVDICIADFRGSA